jgi:hypothetical protein
MKKLLIAALAATAFTASPAFAQATGEIAINGNVTAACGTGHHISGAAGDPAWDQSDISIDLSGTDGQFHGQTFTNRSWGNVWCNGPANVTISVGALTSSTPVTDTGSFTNRFDVRITTDAGVYVGHGTGYVLSTAGVAGGVASTTAAVPGAFETGFGRFGGATSIEVLQPNRGDGEGPLRGVAGSYAGYVRFTATAS